MRTVRGMVPIPAALVEAVVRCEGQAGRRWIHELPSLITRCLDQWSCELAGGSWHGEVALVLTVQPARGPAVLKISFPHRVTEMKMK